MGLFSLFKKKKKTNDYAKQLTSNVVKSMKQISDSNYTPPDIDVVLNQKLDNGLFPGEIVLINWLDNRVEPLTFPKYFEYKYGLNASLATNKLLKNGLIEYGSNSNALQGYKVADLKEMLINKNLPTSGKKADLIKRLASNMNDDEMNNLPKSYIVTDLGVKTIKTYEYIIKSHSDRYFPTAEAILFKKSNPMYKTYGDLKWAYLNRELNIHNSKKRYGLLRNVFLARADQLHSENKHIDALSNLIAVQIIDCSGLGNSPYSPYYENVMIAPGILTKFEQYNHFVTDAEYSISFDGAVRLLHMLNAWGFLKQDDLDYLKKELRKPNKTKLEKYFSKFKKYTVKRILN